MTLGDLSRALQGHGSQLSVSALSRIEAGLRRIDVDDLVAICRVLGLSPNDLLGYESQPAGFSFDVTPQWLVKFFDTAAALKEVYEFKAPDGDR